MAYLASLGQYKNTGLLLVRIGIGTSFIFLHGYPKLMGGPETWAMVGGAMGNLGVDFYPTFWGFIGGLAEVLGGLFIVLGLFFRPACIFLAFTMLVAMLHHIAAGDGWGTASHALELGVVFIGLLFVGPGKYSVDKR